MKTAQKQEKICLHEEQNTLKVLQIAPLSEPRKAKRDKNSPRKFRHPAQKVSKEKALKWLGNNLERLETGQEDRIKSLKRKIDRKSGRLDSKPAAIRQEPGH
jgi:hypothetical protein